MLKFGNTIRRFRQLRGTTQRELAKQAEVSVSFLSQIENDHREPSPALVRRIAGALEVPIDFVLWDAIEAPRNVRAIDRRVFDAAKKIVERYAESLQRSS